MSSRPVVFSAVPTLFGADGELDPGANRALYGLVNGLVDGLFVAGTTGEFPALEDAERLSLFELALAEAGPGRVIAHIGAPDARHAARLARGAVALGATRIAAITRSGPASASASSNSDSRSASSRAGNSPVVPATNSPSTSPATSLYSARLAPGSSSPSAPNSVGTAEKTTGRGLTPCAAA